jgi:hypothetical protein
VVVFGRIMLGVLKITIAQVHITGFKPQSQRYTRKYIQVVTNLQQTCSNAVSTTCQQDVFADC